MTFELNNINEVRGKYRGAFLTKEIIAHIQNRKAYADKLGWECGINLAETEIALLNAHEENKRLREALEFYADPRTYKQICNVEPPEIWVDEGEIARQALEGE